MGTSMRTTWSRQRRCSASSSPRRKRRRRRKRRHLNPKPPPLKRTRVSPRRRRRRRRRPPSKYDDRVQKLRAVCRHDRHVDWLFPKILTFNKYFHKLFIQIVIILF